MLNALLGPTDPRGSPKTALPFLVLINNQRSTLFRWYSLECPLVVMVLDDVITGRYDPVAVDVEVTVCPVHGAVTIEHQVAMYATDVMRHIRQEGPLFPVLKMQKHPRLIRAYVIERIVTALVVECRLLCTYACRVYVGLRVRIIGTLEPGLSQFGPNRDHLFVLVTKMGPLQYLQLHWCII